MSRIEEEAKHVGKGYFTRRRQSAGDVRSGSSNSGAQPMQIGYSDSKQQSSSGNSNNSSSNSGNSGSSGNRTQNSAATKPTDNTDGGPSAKQLQQLRRLLAVIAEIRRTIREGAGIES